MNSPLYVLDGNEQGSPNMALKMQKIFLDNRLEVLNINNSFIGYLITEVFVSSSSTSVLPTVNKYIDYTLPYFIDVLIGCALVILLTKLWDIYVRNLRDSTNSLPLPPGSSGWPFIGETIPFVLNGRDYFQSRLKKYGLIYRSHLVACPTVVVCGAANVRKILNGEDEIVTINPPPTSKTLFGACSLSNTIGNNHNIRHQHIRRAFNHHTLTKFNPKMTKIIHECVNTWCERKFIHGVEECKRMIFELGAELVLGLKFGTDDAVKLLTEFEIISDNFFTLPIDVKGSGFRKAKQAREVFVEVLLSNTDTAESILGILREEPICDNTQCEKEDCIYDVALEILFAMASTTASACAAMITALSKRDDVINSVRQEVEDYVSREGLASHCDLTFGQMASHLPYVNGVMKEVLRLNPPVAGGFRKALKTFELEGYQIPKGWGVLYCITDTHEQSPGHSPAFCPERWLKNDQKLTKICDENANSIQVQPGVELRSEAKSSRYDYIPFSAGSRVCPGKEFAKHVIRLLIVEMCMSTRWKLKNKNSKIKTSPIPFDAAGLPMHIWPLDMKH